MTQIEYEEASEDALEDFDNPVVLEEGDFESLADKAEKAEELSDRIDSVDETLEQLAQHEELMADVDEEALEDLREFDSAVVLTEEEHEELQGLVDDVTSIYAEELAEYSPFTAEELADKFGPTELRERVEDHDEASLEVTSDPEPEGGAVDNEELGDGEAEESGSGDGLTEDEEEQLREAIARDIEEGSGDWSKQADMVRSGEISLDELGVEVDSE